MGWIMPAEGSKSHKLIGNQRGKRSYNAQHQGTRRIAGTSRCSALDLSPAQFIMLVDPLEDTGHRFHFARIGQGIEWFDVKFAIFWNLEFHQNPS